MSILKPEITGKHSKKRKKSATVLFAFFGVFSGDTENRKNAKYRNIYQVGARFYI